MSGRRKTLMHLPAAPPAQTPAPSAAEIPSALPQPHKKRQSLIPGLPGIRRQSLAPDSKAKRKARHSLGGPPAASAADDSYMEDSPASAAPEPANPRARRTSLGGGVAPAARRKSLGGSLGNSGGGAGSLGNGASGASSAASASSSVPSSSGPGSSARRMSIGGGGTASGGNGSGASSSAAGPGSAAGFTANLGGGSGSGGVVSRRSSVYGRSSLKDPRPVGNKEYTKQCIEKLVRFLASRRYPAPVSKKGLKDGPTAKEFREILEFLVQQIDPGFSFEMERPPASASGLSKQELQQLQQRQQAQFEAEVPALFKRFGYPFSLGQRSLSTISMLVWPTLLAAICWLVDYIEFADASAASSAAAGLSGTAAALHDDFDFGMCLPEPPGTATGSVTAALDGSDALFQEDQQDAESLNDRIFFEFSAQCYKLYLAAEDHHIPPLMDTVAKYFAQRNTHVRLEISQLESGLDALRAEIDSLEACQGDLMKLETQRANLQAQVRKQQAQLAETRSLHRTQAAELESKRTAAAARAEELQELLKQQEELRAAVANQEYRPDEVLRMRGEQEALKEALAAASRRQQELRQEVATEQQGIQEARDGVEEVVRQFNEMALGLDMIPASAANANDHDFELKFLDPFSSGSGSTTNLVLPHPAEANTTSAVLLAEMTNLDLEDFVEPYLLKLRLLIQEQFADANERLQRLNKQLAEADYGFRDQQAKTETLRSRLDKLQTIFHEEHAALTERLNQQVNRVQDLELELHRLDDRAAALEHSEHRVQALQEQLASLRTLHQQERRALEHTVMVGLRTVAQHKEIISKTLRELGRAYGGYLDELSGADDGATANQSELHPEHTGVLDTINTSFREHDAAALQHHHNQRNQQNPQQQQVAIKDEPMPIRVKVESAEQDAPTFDPFHPAVPQPQQSAAVPALPTMLDLSSGASLKAGCPGMATAPASAADENRFVGNRFR